MNLLKDQWIPVRKNSEFKQVSYKELMCNDDLDLQVALPRDDLELACLQILAALTQVIFMPATNSKLRERIQAPLSEIEYENGIQGYLDWFDLNHQKWPFMQVKADSTKTMNMIQKLFPGLPAGNNHAFFNETNEINFVCKGCAAISLFNLCTMTPNISGKHKGGLRGGAPISTMVYHTELRKMIWLNVICKTKIDQIINCNSKNDPVWVLPISEGEIIPAANIGLARGLFWTPIIIKLNNDNQKQAKCDCCGAYTQTAITSFELASDFKFEVMGLWPHLYSPRIINLQKESKNGKQKPEESVLSFRTTKPAWTQLTEMLFESKNNDNKEGYIPAAVVSQFNEIYPDQQLFMIIGGYRNKQAAILQRKHELISVPNEWSSKQRSRIQEVIEIGINAEEILVDKVLKPLAKGNKKKNVKGIGMPINSTGSDQFYYFTEPIIHRMLRESSLKEYAAARNAALDEICQICFNVFERLTNPYSHKPELYGAIAIARAKLKNLLSKLIKDYSLSGGKA